MTRISQLPLSVLHMFVLGHLGRSPVTRAAGLVEIGSFNPALHSQPGIYALQIRERTATSLVLPDVPFKTSIRLSF